MSKYKDKEIDDWNVNDLLKYLEDKHMELFGIEYTPFGSWQMERGLIGNTFGTKAKQGQYPKEVVKAFIDYCFNTYKPNERYQGISFGFMVTYKKDVLAIINKRYLRMLEDKKRQEEQLKETDNLVAWFNS